MFQNVKPSECRNDDEIILDFGTFHILGFFGLGIFNQSKVYTNIQKKSEI